MKPLIKGRLHDNFFTDYLFFIRDEDTIYLLQSLKDVGIVEWMDKCGNCITIFKEHFSDFERKVLTPLQEYYSIQISTGSPLRIANAGKKRSSKK